MRQRNAYTANCRILSLNFWFCGSSVYLYSLDEVDLLILELRKVIMSIVMFLQMS